MRKIWKILKIIYQETIKSLGRQYPEIPEAIDKIEEIINEKENL